MYGLKDGFGAITWWAGLDWKLRLLVAGTCIGISTVLYVVLNIVWLWGWAVGVLLVLMGGQSRSEKNGYRF